MFLRYNTTIPIQIQTLSLPVYAINQNGSASCSINYTQVYLSPRQVIDATLPFTIPGSAIVNDTGDQRLPEYLKSGAAFATLIAPALPGAGVVAVGIQTALASPQATQLSSEVSSFSTSTQSISGPLVYIEPASPNNPYNWYQKTYNNKMYLQPYTYWNTPDGPSIDIGLLTIHIFRTTTIIGTDPITIGRLGELPNYDNLSQQTRVFTLVTGTGNAMIPNSVNVYEVLNQTANVATVVNKLPASAKPSDVSDACGHMRDAIIKWAIFNRLDATAYLWRVYSWSPYAATNEPQPLNTQSPCLNPQEQEIVKCLGSRDGHAKAARRRKLY